LSARCALCNRQKWREFPVGAFFQASAGEGAWKTESKVQTQNFKVKIGPMIIKRFSIFGSLHPVFLPLLKQCFSADAQNLRGLRDVEPRRFKRLRNGITFQVL